MAPKRVEGKHEKLKKMKDDAVEWLRKKKVSETIIKHNVSLFYELASSMNNGSNNNGINPYDLLCLSLYHEDFRSIKMLPPPIQSKISKIFQQFLALKKLDMSKKEHWSRYSMLSDNISLAVFRTIDLAHLPNEKKKLTNYFVLSRRNADKQIHNLAQSILYIYTPFADILGLNNVMNKLRDYSSKILYPKLYSEVVKGVNNIEAKLIRNKSEFNAILNDIVNEAVSIYGVKARIYHKSRIKTPGSITLKLLSRDMAPKDLVMLHDLIAFTVITETEEDAYMLADIIKEKFKLNDENIGDYIKNPRGETGYQSIHVDIPYKDIFIEVQIKTKKMHERCEKGDWAHALFKPRKIDNEKILLLSNFSDFLKDATTEDIEAMSFATRSDRITVTVSVGKKTEEVELPVGACAFDLVCKVSDPSKPSEVTSALTGRKRSMFYKIKDGGHYRVKVSSEGKISKYVLRTLLNCCVSIDSRRKIRSLLIKSRRHS